MSRLKESHENLIKLNGTLTQIIRKKQPGPAGSDGVKGSKGDLGQKGGRGMKGTQGDRGN